MYREILYPYANNIKGNLIHIDRAQKKQLFTCIGCFRKVVPVQGKVRTWHFRHYHDNNNCNPDNTLHKTAQLIIERGFKLAVESESTYEFMLRCSNNKVYFPDGKTTTNSCSNSLALHYNAATPCASIKLEDNNIIEGTRPDLVIRDSEGNATILEVIVTHNIEDKTRTAYENSNIPVLSKTLTKFEELQELEKRFSADASINIQNLCAKCIESQILKRERMKKSKEDFTRRKQIVDKSIARMKRIRSETLKFQTWSYNKNNKWMLPRIKKILFANAMLLTELGFEQSNPNKPWMFRFPIHKKTGIYFYADLGSGDLSYLYDDTAAMIYFFDDEGDDESDIQEYIIDAFGHRLCNEGVNVQTWFPRHQDFRDQLINPIQYVEESMLESIMKLAA